MPSLSSSLKLAAICYIGNAWQMKMALPCGGLTCNLAILGMRLIAGALGGRYIQSVPEHSLRPAMGKTREALFSMLESRGADWPHMKVLDLFAGSGSLALEAISRGALAALLVEMAPRQAQCIRNNIADLQVGSRCILMEKDVLRFLRKSPAEGFDLAFIDPPYGRQLLNPVLQWLVKNSWLLPGAFVAAEIEKNASPRVPDCFCLEADRLFGQTRLLVWKNMVAATI